MKAISSLAALATLYLTFASGWASDESKAKNKDVRPPWYLKPVVRPDVPADVTASHNPIDAFLAHQQQAKGLKPNGSADRRTLLRRVYLDLIGIPPTIAEQDAFLA